MDNQEYIRELADKWIAGTITDREKLIFDEWYNSFDFSELEMQVPEHFDEHVFQEKIRADIKKHIPEFNQPRKIYRLWPRIAVAASILFILSIGGYFILHKTPVVQVAQNDIAPDSTRVILKTGHGKTYLLAGQAKGMLYQQGNTAVKKTANDQLAYANSGNHAPEVMAYDTIQVPTGGPYHLNLSDGSKITLNNGTTLRYPTNFNGDKRDLELIAGEAFFEVVHNDRAPLRITTPKETIEDIGTKFNVNVYPDEPDSRTTLTEGSIKVINGGSAKTLTPGQQAIVKLNKLTVAEADMDAAMAWLDNDFVFHNQELTTIMRQIARWYHIEVTYQDNVGSLRFSGMVSRNHKISSVLAVMENTGKIHFVINGRKVTVLAGRKK